LKLNCFTYRRCKLKYDGWFGGQGERVGKDIFVSRATCAASIVRLRIVHHRQFLTQLIDFDYLANIGQKSNYKLFLYQASLIELNLFTFNVDI
jgi:hypothetical protein